MKNLFIPYELALKLKEKGFDEPCLLSWAEYHDHSKRELMSELEWDMKDTSAWIDLHTPAPTYEQVVDWFDSKGITIWLEPFGLSSLGGWSYCIMQYIDGESVVNNRQMAFSVHDTRRDSYNQAFEFALTLLP